MAVYIKGATAISPQATFNGQELTTEFASFQGVNYLKCIEPAYREFIDPMVARRMSRIVKMGVCCALKCMQETGIKMPDAVIAGTGLGCLEDTEKFLASIYVNEERLLNPTPFIQSTHNTIAGAIALAIKCHNYNATYTHRGFSFESALEDAMLMAAENPRLNIIAGGFDELTDNVYTLTKRLGLWKSHPVDSFMLYDYNSRGSLPGEGVAFFMLGGTQGPEDKVRIRSLKTYFTPDGNPDMEDLIRQFLDESKMAPGKIDLVMLGINGDHKTDMIYRNLLNGMFNNKAYAGFKHLCGEYDTSSSFAVWLAAQIIKNQAVPIVMLQGKKPEHVNYILIYNHLRGVNHSLYLIEQC